MSAAQHVGKGMREDARRRTGTVDSEEKQAGERREEGKRREGQRGEVEVRREGGERGREREMYAVL